jgi:hypothetical protein
MTNKIASPHYPGDAESSQGSVTNRPYRNPRFPRGRSHKKFRAGRIGQSLSLTPKVISLLHTDRKASSLFEKAPMKTNMTILQFAILLVCITAFSSTSALARPAPPGVVRVTAKVLNVRSGPGLKFAIVTKVGRGTVLKVIGVRYGWLHVRRPAGILGWVNSAGTVRIN